MGGLAIAAVAVPGTGLAADVADAIDPPAQLGSAYEPDWLTAAGTGLLGVMSATVLHEVGHGVACAAVGGRWAGIQLTEAYCEVTGLGPGDLRFGAMAGPMVNLGLGSAFTTTLLVAPPEDPALYHFLWFASQANLYLFSGYFLIDALTYPNGGDAAFFLGQLPDPGAARVAFGVVGAATFIGSIPLGVYLLQPMLGSDKRFLRTVVLSSVPILGATAVYSLAQFMARDPAKSPVNGLLVGASTIPLIYMPTYVAPKGPMRDVDMRELRRHNAWVVGAAVGLVAVGVLAYGIGDVDGCEGCL